METHAAGRSGSPSWTPDLKTGLIGACSLLLAATVVVGRGVAPAAAMLIVLSALVAWHRQILAWPVLVCFAAASVLFLPVGRYSLKVELPLGLDPWQLAVMLVVLVWLASLLVDPKVHLRRTPLDGPLALIVAASLGSVAVNYGRVAPLASAVLKGLIVFASLVVLYYFISSVVTTAAGVYLITQFIVCGVAVVAFFSIVEQRTGLNIFDHVQSVFPFLQFHGSVTSNRYGVIRALGSADHPLALGALFAMTVPLGIAIAKARSLAWGAPTILIMIGLLATTSRTPVVAIMAAAVVFLWLRPRDVLPLLPLTIPLLIVIKIAAPGSLATVKDSFFPSSGPSLIEEQRQLAGDPTAISGRANFKLRIIEGMRTPILGQGMGTRQTGADNPLRNAPVLDNQWLGLFLDVGLLGVVGWLWLITRTVRRLGRVARTRGSPEGLLAAGFAASISGFAVAMIVYDALAFVQETVVLWVLLALAATLVAVHSETEASPPEPAV
jgi:polysaccharide biosynthesis protein PslJ